MSCGSNHVVCDTRPGIDDQNITIRSFGTSPYHGGDTIASQCFRRAIIDDNGQWRIGRKIVEVGDLRLQISHHIGIGVCNRGINAARYGVGREQLVYISPAETWYLFYPVGDSFSREQRNFDGCISLVNNKVHDGNFCRQRYKTPMIIRLLPCIYFFFLICLRELGGDSFGKNFPVSKTLRTFVEIFPS